MSTTITVQQAGAPRVTISPLQIYVGGGGSGSGAGTKFDSFNFTGDGPYTLALTPRTSSSPLRLVFLDGVAQPGVAAIVVGNQFSVPTLDFTPETVGLLYDYPI